MILSTIRHTVAGSKYNVNLLISPLLAWRIDAQRCMTNGNIHGIVCVRIVLSLPLSASSLLRDPTASSSSTVIDISDEKTFDSVVKGGWSLAHVHESGGHGEVIEVHACT